MLKKLFLAASVFAGASSFAQSSDTTAVTAADTLEAKHDYSPKHADMTVQQNPELLGIVKVLEEYGFNSWAACECRQDEQKLYSLNGPGNVDIDVIEFGGDCNSNECEYPTEIMAWVKNPDGTSKQVTVIRDKSGKYDLKLIEFQNNAEKTTKTAEFNDVPTKDLVKEFGTIMELNL